MKKIIAIILALAAILSFAACGNNADNDTTTKAPETTQAPVAELGGTLEEIADKIIEKTTTIEMKLDMAHEIDLTNVDNVNYYLGLSSADKVERAVFKEPMIGSIAFSLCVIDAKDGADVEALKQEILDGVNYRKWICVAAEKVLVASCGDKIIMIMSTIEIVDDVYNAFNAISENTASQPITKDGEIMEEPPADGVLVIE